jgi:DNA-binding GntR family transcriptional regulator
MSRASSSLAEPLERSTLSKEVRDRIAAAIRSHELAPGTRLVEAQLARDLGVSRAPVREALQQLARTGLVVPARDGYHAPLFDMQDLRELLQLRVALEQLAARLIADDGSAHELDEFRSIVSQMQDAEGDGVARADFLSELDREFHRLLCARSGNARLVRCWDEMAEQINLALLTTNRAFPRGDGFAEEHLQLLRPIANDDRAACDAAIEDHILRGLHRYEAGNQTQGQDEQGQAGASRSIDQKRTP